MNLNEQMVSKFVVNLKSLVHCWTQPHTPNKYPTISWKTSDLSVLMSQQMHSVGAHINIPRIAWNDINYYKFFNRI